MQYYEDGVLKRRHGHEEDRFTLVRLWLTARDEHLDNPYLAVQFWVNERLIVNWVKFLRKRGLEEVHERVIGDILRDWPTCKPGEADLLSADDGLAADKNTIQMCLAIAQTGICYVYANTRVDSGSWAAEWTSCWLRFPAVVAQFGDPADAPEKGWNEILSQMRGGSEE